MFSKENMTNIEIAGNRGDGVRSDCFVSLGRTRSKENVITLNSKVKTLYGEDILNLCRDMLAFYGITHAILEIEDRGALPFVLAARMEAVIRRQIAD